LRQHWKSGGEQDGGENSTGSHDPYENAGEPRKLRPELVQDL
jgi:hypothetical protein